jgi:hypothetical protein
MSSTPSKKDFHFFYGHDQKKNGNNACFSNWFPASFVDMNLRELHIIISLVRQDFSLGHNNQQ